jgi:2-polyprenyl-6-methoxyphenol hydroxylase-like FAD-dependent oxidoreductase
MAFILLFKNELSAGLAEVDRALQLNPNSLIFLENIGILGDPFGRLAKGSRHSSRKRLNKIHTITETFTTLFGSIGSGRKNTTAHTRKPCTSTGPCSSGIH